MGSAGRYAASAAAEAAAASSQVQVAQDRRFQTEAQLRQAEGLLGTDAQVNGQLFNGASAEDVARIAPYTGQYKVDERFIRDLEHAGGYGYKGSLGQGVDGKQYARLGDYVRAQTDSANQLLARASQAALAGDVWTAEDLRKQAEGVFSKMAAGPSSQVGLGRGISLEGNEAFDAKAQLATTQARTVGGLVKQGREFLDRDSQTSRDYRRSLTEEGERALAVEAEGARRMTRNFGASGGSARIPGMEQALSNDLASKIGRERADLYSRASTQYEAFSRAFAADSVTFAQSWLQGGSGIRESFQGAVDNLAAMMSEINLGRAGQFEGLAGARMSDSGKAKKAAFGQMIGSAVGSYFGGEAGGKALGSLGGGMATGGGFRAFQSGDEPGQGGLSGESVNSGTYSQQAARQGFS